MLATLIQVAIEGARRRGEGVAQGYIDVVVLRLVASLGAEHELLVRDVDRDLHGEGVALPVVVMGSLQGYVSARDAVSEALECRELPANALFECRRVVHSAQRDLKWFLHAQNGEQAARQEPTK